MARIKYRLGLDLGATSIGWCVYRLDTNNEPAGFVRVGSRIFSDGRDPKSLASLAADRRLARQARRRRDRLLKRRRRMMDGLVRFGLMPSTESERKALQETDPYELRAAGLDRALHPHELGRALYHLCRKRGFKSSRKERAADAKEAGKVKEAIRALSERIAAANCRTVGEYLARDHALRLPLRGRRRNDGSYVLYLQRAMVEQEFDKLWEAQKQYHPSLLTDQAYAYLRDMLLFQRPLLPVNPGRCPFEYPEFRVRLSDPLQQKFRMLQELNNLRLIYGKDSRPLTLEERNRLFDFLSTRMKATFAALRAELGLSRTDPHRFNLEAGSRKELKGDLLSAQFGKPECLGDRWFKLFIGEQRALSELVVRESDEDKLIATLTAAPWNLTRSQALAISAISLPDDFGALSLKALERIVPELQADVIVYSDAVLRAGYQHHSALHTGEFFMRLPYYGEILRGYTAPAERAKNPDEQQHGKIANPTVHIGLNQLRLLVNALIARYGHPEQIVIELTREFGLSGERRREIERGNAERSERNQRYDSEIQALGLKATRTNRQRLQLWEEIGRDADQDRYCIYSGVRLSKATLFSDEVEIDHVLPFSRSLHDGIGNKVLCTRAANRAKGNQTPFEAFGTSPPGYDWAAISERAAQLPGRKALLFSESAVKDFLDERGFLDRHLTDTAYLSRLARIYLSYICHPDQVWVSTGKLTAMLRGRFKLNELLSGDSSKNRDDHRHHALDAAVIGLSSRSMVKQIATAAERAEAAGQSRLLESLELPWPSFRDDLRSVLSRVVASHKPDHGREAALHNDTNYGLRQASTNGDPPLVGHHIPIELLTSGSLPKVADESLRNRLAAVLEGKSAAKDARAALEEFSGSTGIRRVMIEEKLSVIPINDRRTGLPYRYVKGDGNFCYDIFEGVDGRWSGVVVSTFEANQKEHPQKTESAPAKRVMRLHKGDVISLKGCDSRSLLLRVQKFSEGRITLAHPNEANVAARATDKTSGLNVAVKSPRALGAAAAVLVGVDVLGYVNPVKRS